MLRPREWQLWVTFLVSQLQKENVRARFYRLPLMFVVLVRANFGNFRQVVAQPLVMASPYVASGSLSQEDLHRMLSPRLAKLSAERDRDQNSLRNRRVTGAGSNAEEVESYDVRNRSLPDQFRGIQPVTHFRLHYSLTDANIAQLQESATYNLVRELSDYLLDSTFLDCIFDVHREAAILHRHGLQIDSPPPTPSHESSPQSSSDTPRSRPPESNTPITVKCRVCGRMVGAKVFEKHIINCRKLDGSRSSSRAAAKKIAEQELISESTFNDDDFIVSQVYRTYLFCLCIVPAVSKSKA
ncbi:hypothetical protein Y032_0164g3520 [Ancylostoma ceylanicum]|uniref:SAGA-associated factor 11 n=1 Tax=Ancylostoma ceylanicum TaxID=53326 RepID=A0A016SX84_9BILA|nr:hypothetical protein Y032_0164g3520 [Ancylostoma ceylanicum]